MGWSPSEGNIGMQFCSSPSLLPQAPILRVAKCMGKKRSRSHGWRSGERMAGESQGGVSIHCVSPWILMKMSRKAMRQKAGKRKNEAWE